MFTYIGKKIPENLSEQINLLLIEPAGENSFKDFKDLPSLRFTENLLVSYEFNLFSSNVQFRIEVTDKKSGQTKLTFVNKCDNKGAWTKLPLDVAQYSFRPQFSEDTSIINFRMYSPEKGTISLMKKSSKGISVEAKSAVIKKLQYFLTYLLQYL